MDSLQIAASLKRYGFEEVEDKTHALGYAHPALGGQRVYLKKSRVERKEKPRAVAKQPLVLHPMVAKRPAFAATRVASLGPNFIYKNTNMSTFPFKPGESATGIAVDVPDIAALVELLAAMGVSVGAAEGTAEIASVLPAAVEPLQTGSSPQLAMTKRPKEEERAAAAMAASSTYRAHQSIDFATHCCQAKGGLQAGPFVLDQLTMVSEGPRRLRFAPLGNRPAAPKLALVGITPGGQIERFASLLASCDVETAARKAAFEGKQSEIKQLLSAHGFAGRIGISLEGDLNENPGILTTSVVKCCLMVDDGYRFAAPDIAASSAATKCATDRLVSELCGYPTLEWVVVFGAPAWEALQVLRYEGRAVIDVLRDAGLRVVQFPHFAQNFQQRALFSCDARTEADLLARKPDHAKYALAAKQMRAALEVELARE